jgi:hypothetical protein
MRSISIGPPAGSAYSLASNSSVRRMSNSAKRYSSGAVSSGVSDSV